MTLNWVLWNNIAPFIFILRNIAYVGKRHSTYIYKFLHLQTKWYGCHLTSFILLCYILLCYLLLIFDIIDW